jgi:hypothetical protein
LIISAAFLAFSLAAVPIHAQVLYGSIVGNVNDPQGSFVPGVTITATNTGTGAKAETVTDPTGAYTLRNLLPGVYDVSATLTGFREHQEKGINVTAGNPGARQRDAGHRRGERGRAGHQRENAPADRQGRPPHRAGLRGDHQPAAERLSGTTRR